MEQPFENHNGGRIGFNHTSSPGDPDFGLLYIGMADGGAAGDELDIAQNLGSVFGKILRIHPLGSNSANGRYGVPEDNPYAWDGVDRTLGEIFASGVRNPQGFDWDAETGNLLMADIGQSVVETLNVVPAGGDLGWNTWEGSYRVVSNTRVELSNPRGEPWITYPVAEFDQNDPLLQPGSAATGVVAYRDGLIPQLTNRVLWGGPAERRGLPRARRRVAGWRTSRGPKGAVPRWWIDEDAARAGPGEERRSGSHTDTPRRSAFWKGAGWACLPAEQVGRGDSGDRALGGGPGGTFHHMPRPAPG